ncbi:MAG: hypothetical protein ACJ8GN_14310 [Longimicrobiaceae bacterium]
MPLFDGSPEAERVVNERYRRMTPTEKFELIASLNRAEKRRRMAAIRSRYGDISEEEMRMRLGVLRLGRETMVKIFGWGSDE